VNYLAVLIESVLANLLYKTQADYMKSIFLLILLSASFSVYAEDNKPSMATIQTWWHSKSNEKMTARSDLFPVSLKNHEQAFLLEVLFDNRGRNFRTHVVMIRPQLKEVREIKEPVCRDVVVHDFNHDGISEVESACSGSGQGTMQGEKTIVQFDGWNPVILYRADFYIGGYYGEQDDRYGAKSVSWQFVDIDGDKVDDLIETVTLEQCRNNKEPVVTKSRYKFVFKNNKFIRYVTYLQSIGRTAKTKHHISSK
jgi:hypothetical protein